MGRSENEKTKKYKIKNSKKSTKKNSKKSKHPKLKKFIIICIIAFILLCLVGIGIFAGIFFSDKWKIEKEDLVISNQNTTVYDSEQNLIAELMGDENRKIIPLSEMGEYLPDAFVAIEDERFYSHSGIDIKRTAGATITYILNRGSSSFGGSTITQQLVKNMMNDDADEGAAGVERKIREMSRAYQIEKMLSKSQILETYLNKIFMGGTVYGVESASKYYFNKSAKELSLAQAAFIAGINHAPNAYNPYGEEDNSEIIKTRTKVVLSQMKKLGKITDEEEYNKAVEEVEKGLEFKQAKIKSNTDISYHTAAAIEQVVTQLAEEKDIKYEAAKSLLYSGGYKLYTTAVEDIQTVMEEEFGQDTYIEEAEDSNGKTQYSQAAMVIIDHKTGYVVGSVGGLGEDADTLGQNRATQSYRQGGSAMKPVANIAPALEAGVITAATVYDDSPTSFGTYDPGNSTGYPGLITVRESIARSSNIVNIKIMSNLGVSNSIKFLNEIGLTEYNVDEDGMLSLAIGGSANGSSPLQMAAAYATFANGGEYITPTYYTKLEDSDGKTVLEPEQETRRVMTEANAYIVANILKSPVTYGTATSCSISGMEVGAKTGTTSDYKDKWLCGITPYYAAATWYGFDDPAEVDNTTAAMYLWRDIMREIHSDLDSASFERPDNIVTATICEDSGKTATKQCKNKYTEVFVSGTVPSACKGHEKVEVCKETGKLATEYCPEKEEKTYIVPPEKEVNPDWSTNVGKKYNTIKDTCTKHTEETQKITVTNVVGKTETEAKDLLIGLEIRVIFESDSSKANGVVLEQSIAEGTKVKKGETIILTINEVEEEQPEVNEEEINQIEEPEQTTNSEVIVDVNTTT